MPSKKFTCQRCGAPKINPYFSPYVMCDFCGNLVDIDYAVGYKVWQDNSKVVEKYNVEKVLIETQLKSLQAAGKKEDYEKLQYHYWDYYYKAFPEYLPPTVNTPEIYNKYMEAAAVMSTDYAFNPNFKELEAKQQHAYQTIKYYQKGDKNYVEWNSFMEMYNTYMKLVKESFVPCYSDPRFEIMQEVLPEDIHLKLKISQLVQIWVPYLEGSNAQKFLEMTGLRYEYGDVQPVKGGKRNCSNCRHEQFVPENTVQYVCEQCNTLNKLKTTAQCTACGTENQLPVDWHEEVTCTSCGAKIRVVVPLFQP